MIREVRMVSADGEGWENNLEEQEEQPQPRQWSDTRNGVQRKNGIEKAEGTLPTCL